MIIQLNGHYSGLLAGRAQYAPGRYDTAKGEMPHSLALYLLNTEQASEVKPEAFSAEVEALATLAADQNAPSANEDTLALKPSRRKSKGTA